MFQIQPINWQFRSPYQFLRPGQLPPAGQNVNAAAPTLNDAGNIVIAGSELQPYQNNAATGEQGATVAVVDNSKFGDSVISAVIFTSVGLPLDNNGNAITFILPRPNNTRILLLIANTTLGQLWYNFNSPAGVGVGVPIAAGGNRLWDTAVPQGNLSLFATAAGTVQIEYMNNNVS